jgi:acyl-[acyl-carrier-protein]-phospholipid O-acyltransferase/long-chain-fatty-acid--[acyl-carrier-protein] ligase
MRPGSTFGWEIFAAIARLVLRAFFRVRVRGELPVSGRMLIVANHQSFLDGILLGAFLPVNPTYLVHTLIATRWYFRLPLMLIKHVVTDTRKPLVVKTVVSLIESNQPVMIFPEGRITITSSLMKVYDGPAFVAAKTGCAVVPVHIEGAIYSPFSRMSGDFPRKLFPRITIDIQPAVHIAMPDAPTAKLRRRQASETMRRLLQNAAYRSRTRQSLFESLLDTADLHGRSRSVLEDISGHPASYRGILKGSLALGRLVSRFTAECENVGVLMPNANATVFLLFGMFATRRVPAMLNFTSGAAGLQNACRIASIRTVITSHTFVEKARLADTIERLKDVKIVYLEDLRPQFRLKDKLWLIFRALPNPRAVMRPVRPEEPAVILFTSGSEGVPKGVVLSHDSILANVAQIRAAFPFSSKEKFLSALPIFHAFGLTAGIVLPLTNGCRVFLYPSPLHYRVIPEVIYDRDCTVLFATNTFLGNYAKVAHPYDFYGVRYLVVGAEKLTEDVQQLCLEKLGLRVLEGYGATECSPVVAVNTPLAARMGSVGEVLPGMETRVAPVEGVEQGGVLHVRGDNVMLGYLKHDQPGVLQPPESEFGPGWYNTGDVVKFDDGFVRIRGRLKRFAKVAGEMVSLEVVEEIANGAQPAQAHAAIAIKEAGRGEAILLFTEDPALSRPQLLASARQAGAPEIAVPRRIVYMEKLPMLGSGKKDYVALARAAEEMRERPEVRA